MDRLGNACKYETTYAIGTLSAGYVYLPDGECGCNIQVYNIQADCADCQGAGWLTDRFSPPPRGAPIR